MFEAEFTHRGDLCTFEVLVRHFRPHHLALAEIAQLIRNIDLKDSKFGRPEAPGLESMISGICLALRTDEERLDRGCTLFDDLLVHFSRRRR